MKRRLASSRIGTALRRAKLVLIVWLARLAFWLSLRTDDQQFEAECAVELFEAEAQLAIFDRFHRARTPQ